MGGKALKSSFEDSRGAGLDMTDSGTQDCVRCFECYNRGPLHPERSQNFVGFLIPPENLQHYAKCCNEAPVRQWLLGYSLADRTTVYKLVGWQVSSCRFLTVYAGRCGEWWW